MNCDEEDEDADDEATDDGPAADDEGGPIGCGLTWEA